MQEFDGYTSSGFHYDTFSSSNTLNASTYVGFTLEYDVNNVDWGFIPAHCFIKDLEIQVSSIASSAAELSVAISYDASGAYWLTGHEPSGATNKISESIPIGSATTGTCVFDVQKDMHRDPNSVSDTNHDGDTVKYRVKLYVWLKTDAGSCDVESIKTNWRAGIAE